MGHDCDQTVRQKTRSTEGRLCWLYGTQPGRVATCDDILHILPKYANDINHIWGKLPIQCGEFAPQVN